MSTNIDEAAANEVCASCGITAGPNVNLRKCTACKEVKYCGVECQKNHRPKHKKACKKRAAELHDDILFADPDSTHEGDCPICLVPHSLDLSKSVMMTCCSKTICLGCEFFNMKRELEEGKRKHQCPYCRMPYPETEEEIQKNRQRRVEANDDVALRQLGTQLNIQGDFIGAVENWKKAAAMGNNRAHYELSVMYQDGRGVEQDKKKQIYHLEVAAIGGNPKARYFLGHVEYKNNNLKRAVIHYCIAAKQGYIEAFEEVNKYFADGVIPLGLFMNTVRGYQAAIDATKSPQREEAEAVREQMNANSNNV